MLNLLKNPKQSTSYNKNGIGVLEFHSLLKITKQLDEYNNLELVMV